MNTNGLREAIYLHVSRDDQTLTTSDLSLRRSQSTVGR